MTDSRFERAVNLVTIRHPFFATIMLQQQRVESEQVGTMAVDGKKLFWNRSWTEGLSDKECVGVIAHECMHLVLMHHVEAREYKEKEADFDMRLYNIAADFVINALLLQDPQTSLPKSGCMPEEWDEMCSLYGILPKKPLTKLRAREVYDLLKAALSKKEIDNMSGAEDIKPCEGDAVTERADAQTMANSAYATAKQAGNLPGYIEEVMGQLTTPQVNWQAQLWDFVSSCKQTGYTFMRPNRRYNGSSVVMPARGVMGLPALNAVFDSSGSVSRKEFVQFLSELNAAAETMGIKDIICVVCDTKVQAVHHRSVNDGEITFAAKGRGGTILDPAFEELKKYRPAPIVCFSDGYFSAPQKPNMPVMWCLTSDQAFPYGKHIRITA